jgi:integrase/recombinase XerD
MEKIQMVKKTNNMSVEQAFALFIRKCRVKNLTDLSISSYEKKIIHFYEFMDSERPVAEIKSDTIDDYILWLRDNTQANDITINSYLRAVRAFVYYCQECGYVEHFKIHLIKADKEVKETYTNEELARLLAEPHTTSFSTYKTWAFENFLLGTGCRISTALNVKIGDVDFENGLITYRKTKNRKQQIVPLSKSLEKVLLSYLEVRGGEAEDYLFCNEYGNQASERTYQQLVRRYNLKRNVNTTSCHSFRHTYAKLAVMNGMDVFRLQRMLGHSDLTVTRQYVELFGNDLQVDFDKFSPLDNLKTKQQVIRM